MQSRSPRKRWSDDIKKTARKLRESNLTYGEISKRLHVARSTLHLWVGDIKRPNYLTDFDRKKHLVNIRKLAVIAHHNERENRLLQIRRRVAKEIGKYPIHDILYLRSLLSMLYWAEGSKGRGSLTFANTDPLLALLFITLLRKSYQVNESKFRARLHLHYYHKINETRKFWSSLLEIPVSKFGKIYMKKRSKTNKFRKNFAGICFIRYYDENLRYEILENGLEVAEKIVPVAQLDRARPCGG